MLNRPSIVHLHYNVVIPSTMILNDTPSDLREPAWNWWKGKYLPLVLMMRLTLI